VLPLITKDLPYDPARDLRPVGLLYADDGSIAVRADLGVETLAQFVNLARAKPQAIRFGSGGVGSIAHLAGERFALRAGIQLLHVPYKGEQYGIVDLLGGRIDMYPLSELQAAQLSAQGKVRVLAVRGPARSSLLPDVPTLAEAGFPDAEGSVLVGLFVPTATPDRIVRVLYEAASRSLTPEVRERIRKAGGRVILQDAAQAQETLRADSSKWEEVVRKVGLYVR
jgi:tripartite-type tricarboxylate transporter receptor subunit TctC